MMDIEKCAALLAKRQEVTSQDSEICQSHIRIGSKIKTNAEISLDHRRQVA